MGKPRLTRRRFAEVSLKRILLGFRQEACQIVQPAGISFLTNGVRRAIDQPASLGIHNNRRLIIFNRCWLNLPFDLPARIYVSTEHGQPDQIIPSLPLKAFRVYMPSGLDIKCRIKCDFTSLDGGGATYETGE